MKLKYKYLENGKTKEITINNTIEQLKLRNRQRNGEITIIKITKL